MVSQLPPSPAAPAVDREILLARLREMQACADNFFFHANAIKGVPLMWASGFLNLYIGIGRRTVEAGRDFRAERGELLPMTTREAAFLGSIIGHVFGPALRDPAARRAFLEQAFGPEEP